MRNRGITLDLLDFSTVLHQARQFHEVPADHTVAIGLAPWGIKFLADGRLLAVCSEGVGFDVRATRPLEVGVHINPPDYVSLIPADVVYLPPDELWQIATGGKIDLADLVNTGSPWREANFSRLYEGLAA
jgi:hypothetical protein